MGYISCSFCGGRHNSRNCKIEQSMAPLLKKEFGLFMEKYIVSNIICPKCNFASLYSLNNHTPSTDIICSNCNTNYELKSKCLSVENLPNDIYCNGGNYLKFINNININNLELIIVIYGVKREEKQIIIREILYAPNNILNNNNIIEIKQKDLSTLSIINVKNKEKLINLHINNKLLSFKNNYDNFINSNKQKKYDFQLI
jgi:hypothetical protein